MWTTQNIAARTFVWLATLAIPIQGLPSSACGCTQAPVCASEVIASPCSCTGEKMCRCGVASSCCQPKTSCCSSKTSSAASCQCGDQCQCGDNCHCGESSVPTKPKAPPVEKNSPERIVTDAAAAASFGAVFLPSTTRQHLDLSAGAHALTAHDCCVALCRFTL